MRAIVYEAPGELAVRDLPKPTPAAGEVLVEVAYLGICGSDLLMWEGGLARVHPPIVMGHEFSGTVVDVGSGAAVPVGTRVAVEPLLACGACAACVAGKQNICSRLGLIGIDVDGAAAEFVIVPAERAHPIPETLSLRHAALVEPTAVACHMASRVAAGESSRVLIVGGGPIGALVAFVCRARGAARIVVSEPNPDRRALLDALGLETIDPTTSSVLELAASVAGGFDVVFELTAVAPGFQTAVDAAAPAARVLLGGIPHGPISVSTASAVLKELDVLGARVYLARDFRDAIALLDTGAIPADKLLTRTVGLEAAISDAYERLRVPGTDMKILIAPNGERA